MSEHSTSEKYLIALASGDDAAAEMPIGAMWRRLNATQRAIVVAAWTDEADSAKALDLARDMLKEMLREIDFTLAASS